MNVRRHGSALIALTLATTALLVAPAPTSGGAVIAQSHPLSGTESSAGHTLTWALGGVLPVPSNRPDLLAYPYDGVVYAGSTVTLTGSAKFTLGAGLATNLTMKASMGWAMSAKQTVTLAKGIGPGSYSLPFKFALKIAQSRTANVVTPAAAAPLNALAVVMYSQNCNDNGVCDGPQVIMYIALLPGKPNKDFIAPTVKALPHAGVIGLTSRVPAGFQAYDSSGKVKVYAGLYSGGTRVATVASNGFLKSGTKGILSWPASVGGTGPFYYCLWAVDQAGNRSPGAPKSACAWLSRQVTVSKVSNGCGTDSYGPTAEWLQNLFGDWRTYGETSVYVRPACNLHDAGYLGATVADPFLGKVVDFRTWSRKQVDQKFLTDVRNICTKTLKSTAQKKYLTVCRNGITVAALRALISGSGGTAAALELIGGLTYYETVRTFGGVGYDWDASTAGTQQTLPSLTVPRGGGRNGA